MATEKILRELFRDPLKDIYFAEKKILTALPKMAKAAHSQELRSAFEHHEKETEGHVTRLEQVFETIDETPRGKTCDAIIGIIEEGQEVMKEYKGTPALDAGLLAAAPVKGIVSAPGSWCCLSNSRTAADSVSDRAGVSRRV